MAELRLENRTYCKRPGLMQYEFPWFFAQHLNQNIRTLLRQRDTDCLLTLRWLMATKVPLIKFAKRTPNQVSKLVQHDMRQKPLAVNILLRK